MKGKTNALGNSNRGIGRALVSRALLGLFAAAALEVVAITPALADGGANWQLTFSGHARFPGTGTDFGFSGSCTLAGATASSDGLAIQGKSGDCHFASSYRNLPGIPSGTCETTFTLTPEPDASGQLQPAWQLEHSNFSNLPDWYFSGTQVIHPTNMTSTCEQFLGVAPTPTFSNFDSLIPFVGAGHANLNFSGIFATHELQLTATPLSA